MSTRPSKAARTTKNTTVPGFFKFVNKSDDAVKFKIDTTTKDTVVGKGPEVRAMVGPILKHGDKPFVSLYPYECVNAGVD